MIRAAARWLRLLALLALPALALAADAPALDAARSEVSVRFTQMGVGVDASFAEFAGTVQFDPEHPQAASAHIEVQTASFDVGDEEYNAEVRKTEWFDSQHFPTATFQSTSVETLEQGFEADGSLTLKGTTAPASVRFSLTAADGGQIFAGTLPVSRKTYAVGGAGWDEVLDDRVLVQFRIFVPDSPGGRADSPQSR